MISGARGDCNTSAGGTSKTFYTSFVDRMHVLALYIVQYAWH